MASDAMQWGSGIFVYALVIRLSALLFLWLPMGQLQLTDHFLLGHWCTRTEENGILKLYKNQAGSLISCSGIQFHGNGRAEFADYSNAFRIVTRRIFKYEITDSSITLDILLTKNDSLIVEEYQILKVDSSEIKLMLRTH